MNEIVIDTILLTDAVNIVLSDYMEHEVDVDMTHVLSTGDRDVDLADKFRVEAETDFCSLQSAAIHLFLF